MTAPLAPVTHGHLQRFREDGFFILDAVVAPQDLQMLRGEAQWLLSRRNAEMNRLGTDRLGLDHRGRRYFIPAYHDSPAARQFLVSGLMARIAAAVLGPAAWLFNEQYVIKAAEHGMRFSWHQDSGFIDYPHQPYLSCWITLDDVSEANGTVYLLPYPRVGTRQVVPHTRDEQTGDLVGYTGEDPGEPVIAPAGSIACFSSTTLHRSGPNTTSQLRRVYLAQYSAQPILTQDGTRPRHLAEPMPAPEASASW